MQEAESSQGKDVLEDEVMNTLGVPEDESEKKTESENGASSPEDDLPLYAKQKIGKLQKRHQRDMRRMQEHIDALTTRITQPQEDLSSSENAYITPQSSNEDERITRAVTAALQQRDLQERKAKEHEKGAEQVKYIHNQYQRLQDHLDNASDKYDDFDEVVRGDDVPFTPAMREAALLIENPAEVLYKLGKNREELNRISKLHPIEQAKEINRLSFALMGGNNKTQAPQKTLGQIKNNPISRDLNEHTSAAEIRARMKSGMWK